MKTRTPTDVGLLLAAARLAGLPLEPARAAQLVPAMDGFYHTLDALDQGDYGETPPAFAYRAKWPS